MGTRSCSPACERCATFRAVALRIVGEDGVEAVTAQRLSWAAGVSEDELRRHYRDPLICLGETYEEVSEGIYEDFRRCFDAEPGWRRALMLASRTLLQRMAAYPDEARLCFVEILRSDHELLRRRDRSRRRLVDLFVAELGRRRDHPEQFRLQLELVIGAGFQTIAAAIESGDISGLTELANELESRALVFEPVAA